MLTALRKTATCLLIAATVLTPTLAEATQGFQYFRMYGGGQAGGGGPAIPPPQGTLFYQISGPATARVGQAYAATSVVTGATGQTAFALESGALPPGVVLDGATGAVSGVPTQAGNYSAVVGARDSAGAQGLAGLNVTVASAMQVSGSPSTIGTVGVGYAAQFSADGGSAPYAFSTTSSLPPGVTLSASGLLAGAPATAGDYANIVIQAQDAGGATASSAPFQIRVATPVSVAWTPADGQVGVPYVASLPQATGGRAPYLYSLSGSVPDGLSFGNSTGGLTGTPTTDGSYPVSITVIDADGRFASTGTTIIAIAPGTIVNNPGPLALSANPPTTAQVGIGYQAHFSASGGSETGYVYDLSAGALPDGLSLDPSTGTISGAPTTVGTTSGLTVRVTDSASATATFGPFSITVAPPPALIVAGNPSSSAQVGVTYSAEFTAFEGSGGGYSFSSVGSALPDGLTLSNVGGASAQLSGVPTRIGTYSGLTIRVTDSQGHTADTSAFSIVVAAPVGPAIALNGNLPAYVSPGAPASAQLSATGGTGTGYVFSVASGALPSGLSLSPLGAMSGTPATAGQASDLTVQVTDSAGDAATASFHMVVASAGATSSASAPIRSADAVSIALSTNLPAPEWTFSQSPSIPDLGFQLSGANYDGAAPEVSVPTDLSLTASVAGGGAAAQADVVPLRIYPRLAVSAPAGALSGTVGMPFGPSSGPTVTGRVGTASFDINDASGTHFDLSGACPGLVLDPASGALSGTPTAVCSVPQLWFVATDSFDGRQATSDYFSISMAPALAISGGPSGAFAGRAGSAFASTAAPSVIGLVGTATFSLLKDGVPYSTFSTDCAGLALSPSSGIISGIPTKTCAVTGLALAVTDGANGATATDATVFAISVAAATASATLTSPATVRSGETISGTLTTSIDTPTWSLIQQPTAPDLTLVAANAPSTTFSGTAPAVSSSTTFSILPRAVYTRAVKADAAELSVTVVPALAVSGGPSGALAPTYGVAMTPTAAPSASGVMGTATFSLLQAGSPATLSSLCQGLSFAAATGVISGTPTAGCSAANLSIRVSDSYDGRIADDATTFSIAVTGPLTISGSPASGAIGVAYAFAPSASGGTSPYSFTMLTDGSAQTLASMGLSFSAATGAITGTPTAGGVWTGSITVKDAASGSATLASLSISVAGGSAPTVSGTIVSPWTTSANIGATNYTASGGVQPYVWSLTGSVPPGLSINASTGAVSGKPTAVGTYNFTVNAKGANNLTGSLGQTLVVSNTSGTLVVTSGLDGLTFLRWPTFDWGGAISSTAYNASGAVTWTMSGNPSWLSVNSSTGVWQGIGPAGTYGTWPITVTGKDTANHTASYSLTIMLAHRTDVEGLQTSLYVNGVSKGTTGATATQSVTTNAPLAVGTVIELVAVQKFSTGRLNIAGPVSASTPSSATYTTSFGDGTTYTNCAQPLIMNGNSVTQSPNCSGALADHWRLTVTAITGSYGSSGFYIQPSGYYSPP